MSKPYLFVDGAYLRRALENISQRYFDGETVPIEPAFLALGYEKTFYYDCLPIKREARPAEEGRPEEAGETEEEYDQRTAPQRDFHNRLRAAPGVHVFEGELRGQKKSRRRQKKVDVAIAVDMMTHSARRNMTRAALITGDLDFEPLLRALVMDGMFVTLRYEAATCSDELKWAADEHKRIKIKDAWEWTPSEFRARHPLPIGSRPIDDVVKTINGKHCGQPATLQTLRSGMHVILASARSYTGRDVAKIEIFVEDETGERPVWG